MKLFASILLVVISASASAWDSAEQAIYEYLKYDANGGRLGGNDWKIYVSTYLAIEGEYDEPGYDMVTVITSYAVSKPICINDYCTSIVTYNLAKTEQSNSCNVYGHPDGGFEKIEFTAKKINNHWGIEKGMSEPHITESTYQNHMAKPSGL